jgi:DNA-directed DNA polymerase III PolC
MKVSPQTHVESFLSASTLANFVERAKELKREYFTCTDLGYFHSSFKAYNLAKKSGLRPILGLEFYFRDPTCSIVSGTKAERCRYFTATIYAEDQEAYQALCKLVSRTDFQTIEIREENQNLLTWKDLESLSKFNTNLVLGGIHCMVGKAYIASEANIGLQLFEKINDLFKGRLSVALICEPWSKKYAQVLDVRYKDGSRDSILSTDYLSTDRARKIKASDLIDRPGHTFIKHKVVGGIFSEIGKEIDSTKLQTGYLPLSVDVTLKINKFLKILADRYKVPVLASDYAYYANKEDKIVQHVALEGKDKIHANQHMKSEEEIVSYLQNIMSLDSNCIQNIILNNQEWAKKFDNFELKYEWHLASTEGHDPLKKAMEIIKRNGRMLWDDPVYVSRLKMELQIIAKNGIKDLTPYFLPIVEVLDHYKKEGHLTSVGRGSAGGSLFCFLLGVTNIDPIRWDLPFSRFFSKTRIEMRKLPDIDTDLPQRETLVGKDGKSGFFFGRWGDMGAQVSTRQTVRLRSAIKDADRYLNGKVSPKIESFTSGLPINPQGVTDKDFIFGYENEEGDHVPGLLDTNEDLQKFTLDNPQIWSIVSKAMGITRAFGRHACAYILSDIPINEMMPTKDGYVTHYEHKEAEIAGGIKYDFLTISQLLDIEICLNLINKRNGDNFEPGYFTHNGKKTYIWDLPEESDVYKSVWDGDTVSLFQINSTGMSALTREILPNRLEDLSSILALERPGPKDYVDPITGLNMVEEYVLRRKGHSEPDIKELAEILPDSYGTLIYQEDLGKVAKQLAGFSDEDAEILRENMAKKKMTELTKIKPSFIAGATKKVPLETAEKIWEQMVTFGRYGFSIIHSYEYAMITYACMFLRHNYSLDWWSSVLTNASEKEVTGKFWPYVKHLIAPPDINLSSDTMVPDYKNNKIRAKLGIIRGMGDKTIDPIVQNRPYKDIQDFVNKEVSGPSLAHKLTHVGILDSLYRPNMSLVEKLKAYEDAVQVKKFNEKKLTAEKDGKKTRAIQPNEGKVPEMYVNIHPLKDAAMKKAVLPTLPIDLYSIGCKYSKALSKSPGKPKVYDIKWDKSIFLEDAPTIEKLDNLDGMKVEKDIYVASTCYVIEAKEFSYSKGVKRALKLTLDFGNGYIKEKVLWPDYNTGNLEYDPGVTKGKIVTVFLRKKALKAGDMNITQIIVES